jgi:hypothetical protein
MRMNSPTLGSQRLLQLAVNHRPELLQSSIRRSGAIGRRETVDWKSPLKHDGFSEYRDKAAMDNLGITDQLTIPISSFWPSRGAMWDALGITSQGRPILVEAKAHIPEAASPGSKATAEKSKKLIEESLLKTRRFLAPRSSQPWSGIFYQYANRLAHQYYLRKLNNLDSSLVFLYFTNAVDMNGPATEREWHGATRLIHAILGLPADLSTFGVYHAFVDARQLTDIGV